MVMLITHLLHPLAAVVAVAVAAVVQVVPQDLVPQVEDTMVVAVDIMEADTSVIH